MSDRELLELAAKAAGYRVHGWINDRLYVVDMSDPAENFDPFVWNPRTDDGDALRLAAKVRLVVDFHCPAGFDSIIGTGVWRHGRVEGPPEFWTAHGNDAGAASRHTIVRAAAEIGRRMQHEH